MKKIFGLLSLIAILTVAFSPPAIATDLDKTDVVVVDNVAPVFAVAEVTDFTNNLYAESVLYDFGEVNYTKEGVDYVATNKINSFVYNLYSDVPIDYGIYFKNTIINKDLKLNLTDNYSKANGYAPPEHSKEIATNTGKLADNTDNYNKANGYAPPEHSKEIATNTGKLADNT